MSISLIRSSRIGLFPPLIRKRGCFGLVAIKVIALLSLVSVLAQIVDAAYPQLRMWIYNGSLGGDFIRFKLLLLLCSIAALFVNGFRIPGATVLRAWLVFMVCLFACSLIHQVVVGKSLVVTWIEYVDGYSLVIFLPLFYFLKGVLSQRSLLVCLVFVFVPLFLLGSAQFVLDHPIVRVASNDGLFAVNSWTISGQIRAFSLFSSGLRYGYFCTLIFALALASWNAATTRASKRVWAVVALCAALGVASTVTRNAMLYLLAAAFTHFALDWLKREGRGFVLSLLPAYMLGFLAIVLIAPAILGLARNTGVVLDTESMSARFHEWQAYGALWLQTDLVTALFGTGLSQMSRFYIGNSGVVVDNVLIGLGLHVGLLGLLAFLVMVWALWATIVREFMVRESVISRAALVAWAPFLGVGMLNASQVFFLPMFFLFLLAVENRSDDEV